MSGYAELQAASNFSFLRGASHPEELVITAAALGLRAIAITDRSSVTGLVKAHLAAKQAGIRLVVGCRLEIGGGPDLLVYPTDRAAYGRLTRLLTLGKRRAPKGECHLTLADVLDPDGVFAGGAGQMAAAVPPRFPDAAFEADLGDLSRRFKGSLHLAVSYRYSGIDEPRLAGLAEIAQRAGVALLATGDVHAHAAARRPLQDVLSCIREGCIVEAAGYRLHANAERHLKDAGEMARLFAAYPDAVARSLEIADACTFSLDELRYEYPVDPVPEGRTPHDELARLTWAGAEARYPGGTPDKVRAQLEHELALIEGLGFAPYFLTVHDIVRFARERDILCQGRGSAANSAVCYCLGITAVDPARLDLLFERFVSAERGEPPDIDVDFENGRREEVIQYVYGKYGRERAGMTATVISYRTKSAIREVGKALGVSEDTIIALQGAGWRRSWDEIGPKQLFEAGVDPEDPVVQRIMALAGLLRGFPRHLSQHTGGMVMTKGLLEEVVPIANAAMDERTVIEWDKDDLDALGILKIDILALGMLTCVHKAFDLLRVHHGRDVGLANIPPEDPAVYDMLCKADSVGVFQVESRAQMSMLPRLRPRNFYDLVIEVAIVRPGPIQGDMVHPYLRRRDGKEAVDYPSDALRQVLGKTLGIPLFQEQAMKIAIVAAGFTPEEADGLRRALATFRRMGDIHKFEERFLKGMAENGYAPDFAERCFRQIEGFADYGFPESHAASFALLVYVSSWLKCHYPAAFACALLNSQPMGFYAPAQIVRDAREHGVEVLAPDVNESGWDCALVPRADGPGGEVALRLGFRQVKGIKEADMAALTDAAPFHSIPDLWRRTGLTKAVLERLARADAFRSLGLERRPALWAVRGLDDAPLPLFAALDAPRPESEVSLPAMPLGEQVADDYRALALSLKAHPLALLRGHLLEQGYQPSACLERLANGKRVRIAGLVTARQRPGSAKGVMFATMEDETAVANLIVWPAVFETYRRPALGAHLLGVSGEVQKEGRVIHVVTDRLEDLTPLLGRLSGADGPDPRAGLRLRSRNFQ
ncbi:MAG: error-prone DNA polymerase [Magnetovibrio sp.]|nr:error-prone DNA polymerase [Magnetovibrio sp.]